MEELSPCNTRDQPAAQAEPQSPLSPLFGRPLGYRLNHSMTDSFTTPRKPPKKPIFRIPAFFGGPLPALRSDDEDDEDDEVEDLQLPPSSASRLDIGVDPLALSAATP